MVSRKGLEQIAVILEAWTKANNITPEALSTLVDQLGTVKANKSYRDTIAALKQWVMARKVK